MTATESTDRTLTLDIDGMTCASCVNRIERKLDALPGVHASVNLALENALVTAPAGVSDDDLLGIVRKAGYQAVIDTGSAPAAERGTALPDAASAPAAGAAPSAAGPVGEVANGTRVASGTPGMPDAAGDGAPSGARGEHAPSGNHPSPSPSGTRRGPNALLRRFIVCAVLTVPAFAISMIPGLQFPHWGWVVAALVTPVVTWGAWPFHRASVGAARHGTATMDTLVSLGVTAAYLYSLVMLIMDPGMTAHARLGEVTSMSEHHLYFESAAVITTFLLLGRWLELRARRGAADATRALLALGAKQARLVLDDGSVRTVPASTLRAGQVIEVRPGEKIAADGVVISGHSALDTSVITGESVPVEVSAGDDVTGATINTSGLLRVRVTRVGADSTLGKMGALLQSAQSKKSPITRLADRISSVFVPAVMTLSALTFLGWWLFTGDARGGLIAAVTVLVIACPCALGLATPVALVAGTGRGAQLGILLSGPAVLEEARGVDTIVLDKTGTLTEGRMEFAGLQLLPSVAGGGSGADAGRGAEADAHDLDRLTRDDVLRLVGAAESGSEHPIGEAIAAAAREQAGPLPQATDFSSSAGGGVRATVEGVEVFLGNATWLQSEGFDLSRVALDALERAQQRGATAVVVGLLAADGTRRVPALACVTDTVKRDSARGVEQLKKLGLTPWIVTGDNLAVAQAVAAEVGIAADHVIAGVKPEGKVAEIERLQADGAHVAMVGDGVNDAPALAQANLGMAMGAGTDVARAAADVVLMGSSVGQAAEAISLSRDTLRVIKQNLFWAFAYNVAALPLAVLGLLNPMIAGIAMAASSVIVVGNSLRLRRAGR